MKGFRDVLTETGKAYPNLDVAWEEIHERWNEHLGDLGLDPELFRYQREMNADEGEAAGLFAVKNDSDFTDLLLRAVTDTRDTDGLADLVHGFAHKLGRRAELTAERDFTAGSLDLLARIAEAAEARARARDIHAAAERRTRTLARRLAARGAEERGRAAELAERVAAAAHAVTDAEAARDRGALIAAELAYRHASLALAAAEKAAAAQRRELPDARTLHSAWQAAETVLQHRAAADRAARVAAAIREAERDAAPALAARAKAAADLVRALHTAAEDGERIATEEEERSAALQEAGEAAHRDATAAATEAQRARSEAGHLRQRLAEVEQETAEAVRAGWLDDTRPRRRPGPRRARRQRRREDRRRRLGRRPRGRPARRRARPRGGRAESRAELAAARAADAATPRSGLRRRTPSRRVPDRSAARTRRARRRCACVRSHTASPPAPSRTGCTSLGRTRTARSRAGSSSSRTGRRTRGRARLRRGPGGSGTTGRAGPSWRSWPSPDVSATGAGLLSPPRMAAVMERRPLGSSGFEVSSIGLGCMPMSWGYKFGEASEEESIRVIDRAIELGVNHFDTADVYGPYTNEELVGRALSGRRDEVVLATKVGVKVGPNGGYPLLRDGRPERIIAEVDASLRRLRTDVIDLYYLHRIDEKVPFEDQWGAMVSLVDAGKVRALGLVGGEHRGARAGAGDPTPSPPCNRSSRCGRATPSTRCSPGAGITGWRSYRSLLSAAAT